jgi:hypothetical protein
MNFDQLLGDTWTRVGTDWRQRLAAGGPAGDMIHAAMAFDREHEVAVMLDTNCANRVMSTWTWDGTSWTEAPTLPSPRWQPALAYDSARHRVVLYGGERCSWSPPGYPVDTWEWDGTAWQQVATAGGPGARRYGTGIAYDRARGRIVLFGGSSNASNETTWTWDGPTYRCDTSIAGDINCDGVVDVDDRKIVNAARGKAACAADDTRDLDGDGRITSADERMLVSLCTFAHCARHD